MDWLLAQFLDIKYAEGKAKRTLGYYTEVLTLFGRFLDKSLEEATAQDILAFARHLRDNKRADATVANRVRGIKAFYEACQAYELLEGNPAHKVKTPKLPKSQPRVLTVEEAKRLLSIGSHRDYIGLRNYNLVLLLLDAALRNQEAAGLKLLHVRLKQDVPSVWVERGKGAKDRQVSLHPRTARSLLRFLPVRQAFIRRNRLEDPGYLFLSRTGQHMDAEDVRMALVRLCQGAGVPLASPHDLRHTSATWAALDGMNAYQLAAKLGHSSISTTQIYVHMAEQMRAQWTSHSPIGAL